MKIYFAHGDLSVPSDSVADDLVAIATGSITCGDLSANSITIYAGCTSFTLTPSHPDSDSPVTDPDITYSVSGSYSGGSVTASSLTSEGSVSISAGTTISVSGDVDGTTVTMLSGLAGTASPAPSITVDADITASSNVIIQSPLTLPGTVTLDNVDAGDSGAVNIQAGSDIEVDGTIDALFLEIQSDVGGTDTAGNITITDVITTQAYAKITTSTEADDGGNVEVDKINASQEDEAEGYVQIIAGGTVTMDDKITCPGGNVYIQAYKDLTLDDIDVSNDHSAANIILYSNYAAGPDDDTDELTVDSELNANTNSGGSGTGFDPLGITITNGGNGGIYIPDAGQLTVAASSSRAGYIGLLANSGDITIDSGTLSVDGSDGNSAGLMYLLCQNLITTDATLSASDDENAASHMITVAASSVDCGDGLTVESATGSVIFLPYGGMTVTTSGDAPAPVFSYSYTDGSPITTNGDLDFSGGDLEVSASGINSAVIFGGYPINFSNGDLTVTCAGDGAVLEIGSTLTGGDGLTFGGGAVVLNANASDDIVAGSIIITADGMAAPSSTVTLEANGESGWDGGSVLLTLTNTDSVVLGAGSGQFNISAGSDVGNGGSITVDCPDGEVSIVGEVAADAPEANGGTITINADTVSSSDSPNVHANGGANPGTVTLTQTGSSSDMTLSGSGVFAAGSGNDPATSPAGKGIYISSPTNIVVDTGITLNATPYVSGAGGATVQVTNTTGDISILGNINANGDVTGGSGGLVTITSAGDLIMGTGNTISADGNPCGTINISNGLGVAFSVTGTGTISTKNGGSSPWRRWHLYHKRRQCLHRSNYYARRQRRK